MPALYSKVASTNGTVSPPGGYVQPGAGEARWFIYLVGGSRIIAAVAGVCVCVWKWRDRAAKRAARTADAGVAMEAVAAPASPVIGRRDGVGAEDHSVGNADDTQSDYHDANEHVSAHEGGQNDLADETV